MRDGGVVGDSVRGEFECMLQAVTYAEAQPERATTQANCPERGNRHCRRGRLSLRIIFGRRPAHISEEMN